MRMNKKNWARPMTVAVLVLVGVGSLRALAGRGVAPGAAASPTSGHVVRGKRLTAMQYYVTQDSGTEPPFRNEYWNNHRDGIYVDVVSGEPLFSSRDKFDSGTGWPSFTRPLEPGHLATKTDDSLGESRVEVRSVVADSHLGHVFDDGPPPTGKRYCMNSAALRFIPVADLESAGYGRFLSLFGTPGTGTPHR